MHRIVRTLEYNYLHKLGGILRKGLSSSDLPPMRDVARTVSFVLTSFAATYDSGRRNGH